ncbi:transposase [Streptomyces sp. NPDC005865]|uniref:transposase n=1 Tax=Streptomyces sp. NPDC005865 TaxID=3155453 RepID=UPI0033E65FE6
MTDVLGAPASRNTLPRLIASLPDPPIATPRVVGVNEYAQCKGQVYGTVLVDIETRRPIDLLPDREVDTLAAWLAERRGIEIVCRDRAPFSADGATRGAPQAIQVADRWHLWHNLGEAAEKCVYRHRGCLRPTPEQPEEPQEQVESLVSSPWPTGHRFAERTRAKHASIHALLAAGHSKRGDQGTRLSPRLRRRPCPRLQEPARQASAGRSPPAVGPRRHAPAPHPPRRPTRKQPDPARGCPGQLP